MPDKVQAKTTGDGVTEANRAIVARAFEGWRAGTASFLDILDDEVRWTIAGSGPSARTYLGHQAFVDGAYAPIADRFAWPMVPTVLSRSAEADRVVVWWDGVAEMADGQTYRNSYAWFFTLRDGKVVLASAFLDLPTYDAALRGDPLPAWPST